MRFSNKFLHEELMIESRSSSLRSEIRATYEKNQGCVAFQLKVFYKICLDLSEVNDGIEFCFIVRKKL